MGRRTRLQICFVYSGLIPSIDLAHYVYVHQRKCHSLTTFLGASASLLFAEICLVLHCFVGSYSQEIGCTRQSESRQLFLACHYCRKPLLPYHVIRRGINLFWDDELASAQTGFSSFPPQRERDLNESLSFFLDFLSCVCVRASIRPSEYCLSARPSHSCFRDPALFRYDQR